MINIDLSNVCQKCKGYKFAPYNSNTSATVRLCHCPKEEPEFTKIQKTILDEMQKMRKKL
jgi:hypothetical protein